MIKHIPNLLTLANLLSGTIAVIFAVKGDFTTTAILVVLGIVFDFFDGFVARILKVQAELGKQLDSLADMVTSGVVPGIVMFNLLQSVEFVYFSNEYIIEFVPYLGLLLTLGACYRLANFNIDERQSDNFIGLPTPAMCLFVISLPLITTYSSNVNVTGFLTNEWLLLVITLLLTYLMNAEIVLFSLKFKDFSLRNNYLKFIFLITSLILLITLKFLAIPVVILWYVLLSIAKNKLRIS